MPDSNVIEFIVKKDSGGSNVSLEDMTLETTSKLMKILNSLIEIVQHETDLKLNISLKEGSQCYILGSGVTDGISKVESKIIDAFENKKNRDNVYVNSFNNIIDTLHNCDYNVKIKSFGEERIISNYFDKKFKRKRNKTSESNLNLYFFKGRFKKLGGDNPTIRLKIKEKTYTISCSISEGMNLKAFLFNDISICVSGKIDSKGKLNFIFKDIYAGESEILFEDFKLFYDKLLSCEGNESFHLISEKLMTYYNERNYNHAKKFIKLFISEGSSVMYLRTILLISKGFKTSDELSSYLEDIEDLLESKIGKIY